MGRVLKNPVHVTLDGAYEATVFAAGTAETEKLAGLIPNPKAWLEVPDTETVAAGGDDTEEQGGDETPAGTVEGLTAPYDGVKFAALQAEAKRRGLAGSGTTAELIARLEADDRDKAAGGDDTEE